LLVGIRPLEISRPRTRRQLQVPPTRQQLLCRRIKEPPQDDAAEGTSATVQAPEPPPPLPDYSQPTCPGDNYLWTPGYWDYSTAGYYWVPGAWVIAPWVDALWTPPWWGYGDGVYLFHAGYWGPHIGFYGGINYGFGYTGHGYYGAYWNNGAIYYNRSITNVNVSVVHNVYNYSVPGAHGERVSYNGGRGGLSVRPTVQETAVLREHRTPAVAAQVEHARAAASNREQFAAGGRAKPATLVAAHPLATTYRAPAARPEAGPAAPVNRPDAARPEVARPEARPTPVNRPEAARPEARPEARPAAPVNRPEPAARPVAPESHPAPPESHANRMARPEARPAPPEHTAPPTRPAPAEHAAPAPRPEPQEHHETPPQQQHPAPPQHAAPQQHPAPQEHHEAPPPPQKKDK
jgi:WXXGXW repeat (2 copies)